MQGNLKKAPKLTYKALHPANNKQDVNLALAIFHETTVAACKSYLPERQDMPSCVTFVNKWWMIANAKKRSASNVLGQGLANFLAGGPH